MASSNNVAPFAGAWIEMLRHTYASYLITVAPFAGAWIEIKKTDKNFEVKTVAPFAGAWIEIIVRGVKLKSATGRTLRGCVD